MRSVSHAIFCDALVKRLFSLERVGDPNNLVYLNMIVVCKQGISCPSDFIYFEFR